MSGMIGRALAGGGGALETAGLSILRSELDEKRQVRLQELAHAQQTGRDATRMAHETSERKGGEAFRTGERVAGERFATTERTGRETFQRGERQAGERFQAGEHAADRALRSRQLDQQARQIDSGIRQVDLAVKKGELDLESAQRLKSLHEKYLAAETPEQKESIADQIYTLAGKDKFTPLMGRDEQGNPVFMGAFNTRTGKRENGSTTQPSANRPPIGNFFGGSAAPRPEQREQAPAAPAGPQSRPWGSRPQKFGPLTPNDALQAGVDAGIPAAVSEMERRKRSSAKDEAATQGIGGGIIAGHIGD